MTAVLPARVAGLVVGGARPQTGQQIDVEDPATGEVFAAVASAGPAEAEDAVAAAQQAGPGWAATPPRQRGEVLRRTYELMTARRAELAELIVRENGKSMADALGEVAYAAEFFRWYGEEAVRILGSVSHAPAGDKRILVDHQPVGVSLLVTPWNFPAAMATRKIGPALAAGCTTVLKPASETPLTALAVGELLVEAGAPPGVVNVIPATDTPSVVAGLLADRRVRKLSFTGSTQTGRLLLRQAADRVVNCSMELGGNAPFLVFADADLDEALAGAMVAKMRNGGQACTAANRLYVQRPVYAEFVERLAAAMAGQRVGSGLDAGTDVGPLISAAAREKVHGLVADATARGAQVVTGGRVIDRPGYFYAPTVLADVPVDAPVLTTEIFGPVAPVVPFDDEDEAVALANDTEYGLVAYVYTGDLRRGMRVADRLDAGMAAVNRGLVSDPAAPFGGVKQSGVGREGAHAGLLEYLEPKYVAVAW